MHAYYNEIEPYAAQWLRNLIAAGHIPNGIVDERDIRLVQPDDLRGFAQCHFFAGIAGWSLALGLAGWPHGRPVWTGSCPCQPFSTAGRRRGQADDRHLWPVWFRLIEQCRPPTVFGEQVASPDGLKWLDLVYSDLERAGYAVGATDLCAAGVGAPHLRQRLWFVADAECRRESPWRSGQFITSNYQKDDGRTPGLDAGVRDLPTRGPLSEEGSAQPRHGSIDDSGMGDTGISGSRRDARAVPGAQTQGVTERCDPWRVSDEFVASGDCVWLACTDGKSRPAQPGILPLAHGVSGRVGRLRAYGNAINAQAAAAFIEACQ